MRDLAEMLGIKAISNVWYHVDALVRDGQVIKAPGARGLYIGKVPEFRTNAKRSTGDRRKSVSLQQGEAEKRIKAGKAGRGASALVGRTDRKLDEQARIDEVVRKAKAREAMGESVSSVDVVRMNTSVWGVKGARVG